MAHHYFLKKYIHKNLNVQLASSKKKKTDEE